MKTFTTLVALAALTATGSVAADTYIRHAPGAAVVYIKDANGRHDKGKYKPDHQREYRSKYDHRDRDRKIDHRRYDTGRTRTSAALGIAITYPWHSSGYRPYSTHRPYRGTAYRDGYSDGYAEGFRDGKHFTQRQGPRSRNW